MNTLKLSLENFQSISSGELEFETGLNFIIGQSNSGKTATFRALKACLSNGSGSQRFIKKGTKQAAVTLDYEGNSITWKRTPKESSYIINGEDYVKTGNSNAFKIIEDTGFVRDTNDVIMNIEEELQLPFPFGMSKSDLFKLYEDVFCVSDSSIILKSAKEHEENVKDEIENLETELIKAKRKLEELNKFKNEVDFDLLKNYKDKLSKSQTFVNFLSDGLDVIKTAIKINNENFNITSMIFNDKIIEYKDLIQLSRTFNVLKQIHVLSKGLKELDVIITPRISEYNELMSLKNCLKKINSLESLKFSHVEVLNLLDTYKELVELKNLISNINDLNKIEFSYVDFKNKLEEYNNLKKYKDSLKTISIRIEEAKENLGQAKTKISEIEGQLKEYKVCPLCHKPLDE